MSDVKKTDLYWIIKPIWDSKGYVQGYEEFRSIPSADFAQVRHGRWECGEENSWWCSVCDMGFDLLHGTPQENLYNYCPNCGARMDGEEKNCDTCKHYDKGWDDAICDGCTTADSRWERRDDEKRQV